MFGKAVSTFGFAGLLAFTTTLPAKADFLRNTILGLEAAGFQFTGGHNVLSNGGDLQITRNFQNDTLDFGATELTLNGPFAVDFSFSNRLFRTADISFSTLGQPLQYVFNSSTGGQDTAVSGSFDLDGAMSINQFGFYDLRFSLSSRQDIFSDGRFSNLNGEEQDFDLGPINVSGNIFADVLGMIFDPFFDATNTLNIFESFSGGTENEVKLESAARRLEQKLMSGQELSSAEVSRFMTDTIEAQMRGYDTPDTSFLNIEFGPDFDTGGAPIPEPSTLVLLAGVLLVAVRRKR